MAARGGDVVRFRDRVQAGRELASRLMAHAGRPDVVVVGLPRGGVPVAEQVANALQAPLDIFVVRKLGVPGREELAMGALASGGIVSVNAKVVEMMAIPPRVFNQIAERETQDLVRHEREYRGSRPAIDLGGKTVILVDDGLATGASMAAAVEALRRHRPARVMVAVPVAPRSSCRQLAAIADDIVCALTPEPFYSVGTWYDDFSQVTDDEVRAALDRNQRGAMEQAAGAAP